MSLGVCIPDLIARGKIPEKHAAAVRALYDDLLPQYEGRMGREAAEAMATDAALTAFEKGIKQTRREELAQMRRQDAILHDARHRYRGADPDKPVSGEAMAAVLAWDRKAPYANVEYRQSVIKKFALGDLYDLLDRHRANLLGQVRHQSDLIDVVRELFGAKTDNLNAREIAESWREVSESLRKRFNAAGGAIGNRDDWGLPQSHDPSRVGSVTPDAWIGEVRGMLDRSKMLDDRTGLPLNDAEVDRLLRDVYENIVSEGWVGRQPGAGGSKMLANRRAEQRVLHFADADAWLAYNAKFGRATPWDAMMAHVEGMSRDIAQLEILGPNPGATIRWMKDVVTQDAMTKGTQRQKDQARKANITIDRLWGVLTGNADMVESRGLALMGSTLRSWQAATKLGGAVITAFSDVGTAALTRRFNGLSTMTQLPDMLRQMNPADDAARVTARRAGIIGDELMGRAAAVGRVQLDELTGGRLSASYEGVRGRARQGAEIANEGVRRLADGVLRVSGLNGWTQAGREAMAKEFAATFAEQAGTAWGELNPAFRGFFERYGLGERQWDAIRATSPDSSGGYPAIWPKMIEDQGIGQRLMEGMLTEIDFAVPTGGLRQRAIVSGRARGSLMGELIRTGFQFKMFPVTVLTMHGMRALDQNGPWNMAKYAVGFLAATTLMGAMSYQVASIAKGQDPASMVNEDGTPRSDFWWKAMLKGGGLGVFGDVINSSTNEYGQDVGDLTAGPGFGTIQSVADLAWGKKVIGADGEEQRIRDYAKFLKRETPGGSIWYLRAGWERVVIDTLGELQDENYADAYARMDRRARENGTAYFAPPGTRPGEWRAPDLSRAIRPADDEDVDGMILAE